MVLLQGPTWWQFLISEVTLYARSIIWTSESYNEAYIATPALTMPRTGGFDHRGLHVRRISYQKVIDSKRFFSLLGVRSVLC